jgi:hypothetical protein
VRREKRLPLDEPARLHPNHWSSLEVRVLDLSANGFRAECEARVTVGSCVTLELPGIGSELAYVTWRRGDKFGAKFREPVSIERCGWSGLAEHAVLARMLVERAAARSVGQYGAEFELRRKILGCLPMVRVEGD